MLIKLHSLPINDPITNLTIMPYLRERQEFLKFSFHEPKLLILASTGGGGWGGSPQSTPQIEINFPAMGEQ